MMSDDDDFIPTKGCPRKPSCHQVVVHVDSDKPAKKSMTSTSPDSPFVKPVAEIDMKRARFEVYKFAHNSLDSKAKQESLKELALKLGAVPPKNKAINYKLLKEQRKKEKEAAKEKSDLYRLNKECQSRRKEVLGARTDARNRRRMGGSMLGSYGKVSLKKSK